MARGYRNSGRQTSFPQVVDKSQVLDGRVSIELPASVAQIIEGVSQEAEQLAGQAGLLIMKAVMDALVRYPWPGNVRELQNVIERAVILSKGPTLQVPPADLHPAAVPVSPPSPAASVTLTDAEREHILRALRETNWVLGGPKGAAARLGMKRSTLHEKMKRLGISRPE